MVLAALLVASSCGSGAGAPEFDARVVGRILSRDGTIDGLAGVRFLCPETGSEATSDGEGSFEVAVPPASAFHLTVMDIAEAPVGDPDAHEDLVGGASMAFTETEPTGARAIDIALGEEGVVAVTTAPSPGTVVGVAALSSPGGDRSTAGHARLVWAGPDLTAEVRVRGLLTGAYTLSLATDSDWEVGIGTLEVPEGQEGHALVEELAEVLDPLGLADVEELSGAMIILRDDALDAVLVGVVPSLAVPGARAAVGVESQASSTAPGARPVVRSITGVSSSDAGVLDGKVKMPCGAKYDGGYAVNDQKGMYPLTIVGTDFGTVTGSVTLAGSKVAVRSWSPTKIVVDPTLSPYAAPMSTTLKVTTSRSATASFGLGVVPAIRSRVFGQCTHYVALSRLRMSKSPSSPSAYSTNGTIDGSYVPRAGDQYQWRLSDGSKHTGIVTKVSGPVSSAGGVSSWAITIGDQNGDCRNTIRTYATTFQTKTVGSARSVVAYPQFSGRSQSYACTVYWR